MATTSERGLGAYHVADKERLKAAMQDGQPCWRCGQPMYHWQDLDRDHVIDRAHGGTHGPAVLAHASCNRAAGARAGNLGRRYTISVATAPPAICKACGRQYRYAARVCEMCGAHYHPTYGEQRTCGRVCGVELHRRNRLAKPKPPPSCEMCGAPRNKGRKFCSQTCAMQSRTITMQTRAQERKARRETHETWARQWVALRHISRPETHKCPWCGTLTANHRWCDACLCTDVNAKGRRCGNPASTEGRCQFHAYPQRRW